MHDHSLGSRLEGKNLPQKILGKLEQCGLMLNLITVQWLCKRMPFFSRKGYTIVFRDQDACYLELALKWFCRNNIYTCSDRYRSTHTHMHTHIKHGKIFTGESEQRLLYKNLYNSCTSIF